MKLPNCILVDDRNIDELEDQIINEVKTCTLLGFDIETHDVNAHEGIKKLRKENADGDKSGKGKSVFDWRNMVVTGASLYPENSDNAYYFNLAHADVDNRIPFARLKRIIDSRSEDCSFVSHKAPFEITVMRNSLGYQMEHVIDSMQMCVSAYGPDEFDKELYAPHNFGGMKVLFEEASLLFGRFAPETAGEPDEDVDPEEVQTKRLNPRQQELLNKVIGKTSDADYSYNGLVKELSYGYGLKKVVKSFFNYQMTTFQEVLGDKRHMGELTGEEVFAYGADDAFWAVQLFYKVYAFMTEHCPDAISCFFEQENPMIHIYSDICCEGMKVNTKAIEARRDLERKNFAANLRKMKATIRALLPFPAELDAKLSKYEKWYGGDTAKAKPAKGQFYRDRITDWAKLPDSENDFEQSCQVSSPVSNAWAGSKCTGLSINHYYQTRILMYDLTGIPAIVYKGKVMSDSECRGEVLDKLKSRLHDESGDPAQQATTEKAIELIKLMGELSGIDQRMKLYLTPYLLLTDPETGRMYPEVTSMLASRRMACANPNAMQLAKRGESTYVRGFYLPDDEEEVLVSLDWSQIELVLIGEFSGDKEFAKAFGQLPYNDLHLGTAADVLAVTIPEVTFEMMKEMHKMKVEDLPPKLLIKPNGEPLDPKAAKKYWRTEVGKGSNFNYWYSGALSTVGEKLGWTSDQMWKATERYRERFPEAEAWRVNTIEDSRQCGYIQLPDGHRRYRWEATYEWQNLTRRMFENYRDEGIKAFGEQIIKAIRSRAGNQIVNTMIQGTSATLAKRSIRRIVQKIKDDAFKARFKVPIHDELVFSVHREEVVPFIHMAKGVMLDHLDIVKNLKVNATASVGLTFEPFDDKKVPLGQIELDEAPMFFGFGDGIIMNDEQIKESVNYLFNKRAAM